MVLIGTGPDHYLSFCFWSTGLRPIYVMFFNFLPISFQMKNNDDMWL